jgi:hypothetical protein
MIDNETSYLVISKATSQSLLLYVGEKIPSIEDIEREEDGNNVNNVDNRGR